MLTAGGEHCPNNAEHLGGPAQRSAQGEGGSPCLEYKGQSRKRKLIQWDKQQKRIYNRLSSFVIMLHAQGYKLFRVDLTTANNGKAEKLNEHHRELCRQVKKQYGYQVEAFKVKTTEGNGVLHCVWAIKNQKAYIPVQWIWSTWEKIHGANNARIKLMQGKQHAKNAVRYMTNQYLAGQSSIDRMAYAWKHCKVALGVGWTQFKKLSHEDRILYQDLNQYKRLVNFYDYIPMREMIKAWHDLLERGWCILDGYAYRVAGRRIVKYEITASFGIDSLRRNMLESM